MKKITLLLLVLITPVVGSAGTQRCPVGDLNGDCKVDSQDLEILAQQWLVSSPSSADLDGTNGVNLADFALLAESWLTKAGQITLVINEFMAKNDGAVLDPYGDYDDWIELYNYGDDAVDIGGLYLADNLTSAGRWRIPDTNPSITTIPSHGYLLIWADEETGQGILHASFKLSAGGEQIGLYDAGGNLIDSVTFGPQNGNESYGRLPDGSDNWQVFTTPTPGAPNTAEPVKVVINEIMFHPYHTLNTPENMGQEYIELFNLGAESVNLSGWRLSDGVEFTFGQVVLGAGQYLVVAADVNAFKAKYPQVHNVVGGWVGWLSNSGERIELVDNTGLVIDALRYSDEGDWAVRELGPVESSHRGWQWSDQTDGGGKSLELINPAMPNEYGQNWAAGLTNDGTPGTVNSVAANDIAPLIVDVGHFPIIPRPNDQVTVTARIIDEQASGVTASLRYRVDSSTYQGTDIYPHYNASDYIDITMFDDGAHGDGQAGDGVYAGQIPALPHNTIVEFFIQVTDKNGKSRTWPAPSLMDGVPQQVTNLLYQVDETFDPAAPWVAGSQPIYYIIMTEMERGRLAYIGSHSSSSGPDSQMNGTFISTDGTGTELHYNVGIRNRGHGTRNGPPNNQHIHFPHDRPWKGVGAISFNCRYTHAQIIGRAIFQMAGIVAADVIPVQLRINGANLAYSGSPMYGVYARLEAFNGDFAQKHFPADPNGNLYTCFRTDSNVQAELLYEGANPNTYRNRYFKANNEADDDWSDLIHMLDVLNNAPDATSLQDVSEVINVQQWLHYIALDSLFLNWETGLDMGIGDDYFMYRGVADPRFVLIPHDLDTILDEGNAHGNINQSIFTVINGGVSGQGNGVDGLRRLFNRPEVIPLYYQAFLDLIKGLFNPEVLDPLFDQVLGGFTPQNRISAMKQFVVQRTAAVLAQIPQQFTVDSDLSLANGYHFSPVPVATADNVKGVANAINTRSVLVNGSVAQWSQIDGKWSLGSHLLSLSPGINRIIVQTFDDPNGTGKELEHGYIDLWYDDGSVSQISGALARDRVLDAASGPWQVVSDLTVPAGVTLSIQPGTTLFFAPGTRLIVNGRLVAEGTQYERIRFTRTPGSGNWAGLEFASTQQDNRIAYADMEYCDSGSCAVKADHAAVYMDHIIWGNHTKQYLTFDDSSIILKNSVLPSLTGAELVHYWGFPANGYALFEGNWFGSTTGYNDIIDFTGGQRPGPIGQFINNWFSGGSDDCIDLDAADAHVEGNVFMHVHMDSPRETKSHAVTTGTEYGQTSRLTVVHNLFYDVDHALLSKDGGFITAVNNTIVHATVAAVNMYEVRSGQWQGDGFYGDGNIFYDVAHMFENPDWAGHPTSITMNNSIFPIIAADPVVWTGSGNLNEDPQLLEPNNVTDPRLDFILRPTSPAIGTGPNGRDMGGLVPAGASIWGEPAPRTWKHSATLTVGGPEIYGYKYRVNNGPWSGEILRPDPELPGTPIQPLAPIELANLADGTYTVYAIIKNSASAWQSESEAVACRTWTVDSTYTQLVINEVLAINNSAVEHEGTFPDIIELFYDGPSSMNLSGMSITDTADNPRMFVFPAGVTIDPGKYLVLYADSNSTTSGIHLGFALDAGGDAVYLYDKSGVLIDSVEFGMQLPDLSIARPACRQAGSAKGNWHLTKPTFGGANIAQPLGNPDTLKINEWLANGQVLFEEDFIELYNPHANPVDLAGCYLTNNPVTQPGKHKIGPLSFIAGGGYAVFWADNTKTNGHVGFRLSADGGMIGLFDSQLKEIDKILYGPQTTDVSQGRAPDGANSFDFLPLPTPGVANPSVRTITTTTTLVYEQADKRVLVPTGSISDDWKGGGPFNDSAWALCTGGPGGVGYETGSGYQSLITLDTEAQMYGSGKNNTCYIRVPFTVDANTLANINRLTLKVRYDDGFVAYLNGQEIGRANFTGTPSWNSHADNAIEASVQDFDTYIDISQYIGALKAGANILAIHGMNASATSSDFLISVVLDAVSVKVEGEFGFENDLNLLDGLRITELMYHSPDGSDFDYIELQNITDVSLDLTGVRFTKGVEFTFPQMQLAPGEYVVLVGDLAAFRSQYGQSIRVAGQYSGNLSNNGEDVVLSLALPLEAAIMRFGYSDRWYPTTDGGGESLVIIDPMAHPATWSLADSWQPADPSPGRQ